MLLKGVHGLASPSLKFYLEKGKQDEATGER